MNTYPETNHCAIDNDLTIGLYNTKDFFDEDIILEVEMNDVGLKLHIVANDLSWLREFIQIEQNLFRFQKIPNQKYEDIFFNYSQTSHLITVIRCTQCEKVIPKRYRKSHEIGQVRG